MTHIEAIRLAANLIVLAARKKRISLKGKDVPALMLEKVMEQYPELFKD